MRRVVLPTRDARISRNFIISRYNEERNVARQGDKIGEGKLWETVGLNEIFPTRAKSGYQGTRIVLYATRVTRNQLALALFLPLPRTALFYPRSFPFFPLSLSRLFFPPPPTPPFQATFERLDNENSYRVF